MNKIVKSVGCLIGLSVLLACGGGTDRGELVGVKGGKWKQTTPYGMSLIPSGAFVMGSSDDDRLFSSSAEPKTVSVGAFYMDETEITNSEYRQFVNWVRDSIVKTRLANMADDLGQTPGSGGIGAYAYEDMSGEMGVYDKYMYDRYYSLQDRSQGRRLNPKVKIIWDRSKYPDEYYAEVMDSMYIPVDEAYNGHRPLDVNKLVFSYQQMDIEKAARTKGNRKDFITKYDVKIYPDTTVWIRDFDYSYNEPMHNDYFWHEAYGEYPVVGVNWNQAKAFCEWRTLYKNAYLKSKKRSLTNSFRLPTEAEWEYAARGGLYGGTYPWGGPYLVDDRGCFLANFKPNRGDYASDDALYTVEAKSYEPNGYNLYNMAGNVSEWTSSAYDSESTDFVSTMNPNTYDRKNKRKIVRGGSWKDVAYYLRVNTRTYEYQDSARSYIGFRTVQDYMGVDQKNKSSKNKNSKRK